MGGREADLQCFKTFSVTRGFKSYHYAIRDKSLPRKLINPFILEVDIFEFVQEIHAYDLQIFNFKEQEF